MPQFGYYDRARTWGVEIEAYGCDFYVLEAKLREAGIVVAIEGYNHERRRHWKITSDGSLSGLPNPFELVSPPLKGDEGLAELKKVCKVLRENGVKVNRQCGLHVHHDGAGMTVDAMKAALTIWWKYEDVIQFFVSPSRRANTYAAPAVPRGGCCGYRYSPTPNEAAGWKTAMDRVARIEDLAQPHEGPNGLQPRRYAAVNFHAYWRHGTVEFRSHQGTIEYRKIEAWVVFTQWIITRAREVGCRVTPRMTGQWAEETRFLFRAINWVNLTDPVVMRAKNLLRKRFNEFKAATRVQTVVQPAPAPQVQITPNQPIPGAQIVDEEVE